MNIKFIEDSSKRDIDIVIRYSEHNGKIERLIEVIKSVDYTIKCRTDNNREIWIKASDIYYIESVDKKTFVYCQKDVYETDFRLYQLNERLGDLGYVQAHRSCLLNVNVLASIRPLINSRMEATLLNGEKLNINRRYIPAIKTALKKR